ncbi:hypothetical protein HZH66_000127 [Vespula vulgaris]|uniref:Uncharacterized protein n=1 Tax=Vespula vulgaris TaxID=7454 RepID=A0A834KQP9_VESVU|nr:hypothetical protein HZH66_000127 [Vespula vulgaris]
MNGSRLFDEHIKRCVKKASTDIRMTLQKLQSELSICNKHAFKVVKSDTEKKSMLKGFIESAKQIGKDARQVIHICTGEEQEAFFKCLKDTLQKMKAQRVEDMKNRKNPKISEAEMDQIIQCYTNSFTVAQTRLSEAEERFKECAESQPRTFPRDVENATTGWNSPDTYQDRLWLARESLVDIGIRVPATELDPLTRRSSNSPPLRAEEMGGNLDFTNPNLYDLSKFNSNFYACHTDFSPT